jgi:hypothetical protein
MANVIKYHLDNGNIPAYVISRVGNETTAGLFPNPDGVLIGIGNVTGSEVGVTIFTTKEELIAYMQTYMTDAKTRVFDYANATTTFIPFDIELAANNLWSCL